MAEFRLRFKDGFDEFAGGPDMRNARKRVVKGHLSTCLVYKNTHAHLITYCQGRPTYAALSINFRIFLRTAVIHFPTECAPWVGRGSVPHGLLPTARADGVASA